MKKFLGLTLAIISAAIIAGVVVVFTPPSFPQLNVVDYSRVALSVEEQKALFAGLGEKVRDPMSLQVRNLRKSGQYGICGEVNAKNGFGGYDGFLPFVAVVSGDKAFEVVVMDSDMMKRNPNEVQAMLTKFGCPNSN